jgi:hypothetical protein
MNRAGQWLFNFATGASLLLLFALTGWRAFGGQAQTYPYALLAYRGDGAEVVVDSGMKKETDYGIYLGPLRLDPGPLAVLSLILPITWILVAAIRYFDSAYSAHRTGFCTVCGYDLRATPDRCPECGAAVEQRLRAGDAA